MSEDPKTLERALNRERKRRAHAENLLEEKSRELFHSYEELEKALKELKRNQKHLVQSEKMASLGILSAGVAHEINNPIGFVTSNINTLAEYAPVFERVYRSLAELLEKLPAELSDEKERLTELLEEEDVDYLVEDTRDILTETADGVQRVKTIVAGLQSFAHADTKELEAIDLNEIAQKTLALAKGQLKNTCVLSTEFADLPPLHGNEGRIGQVIMNLVVNASQAVDAEDGCISVRTFVRDDEVVLQVQDNGCGMPESVQEKLFTPFFTTKPVGEGTGLGLSISFGIVEEHGGTMTVESEEGKGTTFSVALPIEQVQSAA